MRWRFLRDGGLVRSYEGSLHRAWSLEAGGLRKDGGGSWEFVVGRSPTPFKREAGEAHKKREEISGLALTTLSH